MATEGVGRRCRRALRVWPSGFACLLLACNADGPASMRLLTWNIGTPDATDPRYAFRLKQQDYENLVRDRIRTFAPDVVFLQEVLSPSRCEAFVEPSPSRSHGVGPDPGTGGSADGLGPSPDRRSV